MTHTFKALIDVPKLQGLMDIQYAATGIPIGIIDVEGSIQVATGWQDICTQFHRVHPQTARRCRESDNFIASHLQDGGPVEYRCKNGLWDIGVPICIRDEHIATLFVGQFHYEDDIPDREFFNRQAQKYAFDQEAYLAALDRLPVFSRSKMKHIMAYYVQFVEYLIEIGLNRIEREEALVEKQKYQERLERYLNELEQFAFVTSHDLQEPIRSIHSFLQLLEEKHGEGLSGEALDFMRYAMNGAARLKQMILGLRVYSKVGTQAVSFEPIQSLDIARNVVKGLKPIMDKDDVSVDIDDLPSILADRHQLEMLLGYLIDNCIQFRQPEIPLKITISSDRRPGEVVFCIEDNGVGIDSKYHEHVFKLFKTIEKKRSGQTGIGVGLTICKRITNRHDGKIWIESKPGLGTKVFFSFKGPAR
jgi:signal transduction histidine kinase